MKDIYNPGMLNPLTTKARNKTYFLVRAARIITCFAILIFSQEILGQGYVKLLDQNRTWKILEWICGDEPCDSWSRYYSIQKDTVIYDTHYKVMNGFILREDTTEQKVFIWYWDHEQLLYDFQLQNGDSVDWLGPSWNPLIVDSVYQISIENELRKCIAFHENEGFSEIWIEGIGSNYGVISPGFYLSLVDGGYELLCVFDGIHPIYGECYPLNIHPDIPPDINPEAIYMSGQNSLYLKGLSSDEFVLEIYDINGTLRDVHQISSGNSEESVILKDYGEGIYIYRIFGKRQFNQGKFLITK